MNLAALLSSPAARWLALPVCAGLGYSYPSWIPWQQDNHTTAAYSSPRGAVATRTMTVRSGITLDSGLSLLNDREDFRDPAANTIACDAKIVPDAKALIGKTIVVTGRPAAYKGRPQIRATKVEVK